MQRGWLCTAVLAFLAVSALGYPFYVMPRPEAGWYIRKTRMGGDLFSRLNAVSRMKMFSMRQMDGKGSSKRPRLQLSTLPADIALEPSGPRPKRPMPQPGSRQRAHRAPSGRRRRAEPGLFRILLAPLVGRKLAHCLSAAVLAEGSKKFHFKSRRGSPATKVPPEMSRRLARQAALDEDLRESLKLPLLSRRLSLRLISRAFGRVLHEGTIHALTIAKRCRFAHYEHKHLPTAAMNWRTILPDVRSLFLEHMPVQDMSTLLGTAKPYPSLRRLKLDGAGLQEYGEYTRGPFSYPSLRSFKWLASTLRDSGMESCEHRYFVWLLLGRLPEPDAMRHLVLRSDEHFNYQSEFLRGVLGKFRRLLTFAGSPKSCEPLELLKASAETLRAVDSVRFGDSAAAFRQLRRVGVWDEDEEDTPASEQSFPAASIDKLLLRIYFDDSIHMAGNRPAFEAFTKLRVLHLGVVIPDYDVEAADNGAACGFSWRFYSALEGMASLRALFITLPMDSNDLRLGRLALETLGLETRQFCNASVELRLKGDTERSLKKLILGPTIGSVLWGEEKVPVEDSAPVASGRLKLLYPTAVHNDPFDLFGSFTRTDLYPIDG